MNDVSPSTSFAYRLQNAAWGVVLLDRNRRVIAANGLAADLLSKREARWQGADLLDLHPPQIRPKVQWLLDAALASPDRPAGMVLNLPEGTVIARVSLIDGTIGAGFAMVFFPAEGELQNHPPAALLKLPLSARGGLTLIDVGDVAYLKADGHYTQAYHAKGSAQCTIPLAELVRRLPPEQFLRVHRSYLVNLHHVRAVERQDDQWLLVMETESRERVPVSRRSIDLLRRRLAI